MNFKKKRIVENKEDVKDQKDVLDNMDLDVKKDDEDKKLDDHKNNVRSFKKALNDCGNFVEGFNYKENNGNYIVHIPNRTTLAILLDSLKKNNIKNRISRSITEGYRYDVMFKYQLKEDVEKNNDVISKLDNTKKYKCVKDNQGGNYLVDFTGTEQDWAKKALAEYDFKNWIEQTNKDFDKNETVDSFLQKNFTKGKVIPFIADLFDIEIKPLKESVNNETSFDKKDDKGELLQEDPIQDRLEEIKAISKTRMLTDDEVRELAELSRKKNESCGKTKTNKKNSNKLKEEYYDWRKKMTEEYADVLQEDVNVYDVNDFVLRHMDGEYQCFRSDKYAIIVCPNGKGTICDYEAVGEDFNSVEDKVEVYVEKATDEFKSDDGSVTRTISLMPAGHINVPVKALLEEAPKKVMTFEQFFEKYNYNDRCSYNFRALISYLKKNGMFSNAQPTNTQETKVEESKLKEDSNNKKQIKKPRVRWNANPEASAKFISKGTEYNQDAKSSCECVEDLENTNKESTWRYLLDWDDVKKQGKRKDGRNLDKTVQSVAGEYNLKARPIRNGFYFIDGTTSNMINFLKQEVGIDTNVDELEEYSTSPMSTITKLNESKKLKEDINEDEYVGRKAIFTGFDDYEDAEELEDYEGEVCTITCLGCEVDDDFESNYWDIEFEDGLTADAVSGYCLELIDDEDLKYYVTEKDTHDYNESCNKKSNKRNLKESDANDFIQALKDLKEEHIYEFADYSGLDTIENEKDADIEYGTDGYDDYIDTLRNEVCAYYDEEFDNLTHTIVNKVDDCVNKRMSYFEIINFLIKDAEAELNESLKESKVSLIKTDNYGKYGTEVKIYQCEGDKITPRGFTATVKGKTLSDTTLNKLEKKIIDAVNSEDKKADNTILNDSLKESNEDFDKDKALYILDYLMQNGLIDDVDKDELDDILYNEDDIPQFKSRLQDLRIYKDFFKEYNKQEESLKESEEEFEDGDYTELDSIDIDDMDEMDLDSISVDDIVDEDESALDILKDKLDMHGDTDGDKEIITIAEKGKLDDKKAPKLTIEANKEETEILANEWCDECEDEEFNELDSEEETEDEDTPNDDDIDFDEISDAEKIDVKQELTKLKGISLDNKNTKDEDENAKNDEKLNEEVIVEDDVDDTSMLDGLI